ncbi:phosphate starvation-inducible protein PhoH, partial [Aliarcobacter butzleri]
YNKHKVEFISLDIMTRTRVISLDIKTNSLLGKDKDIFDIDFIKYIDINFEDLEYLDNEEIIKFDKDYKPYNFSYCYKVKHSDQVLLANIQNKKIKLL